MNEGISSGAKICAGRACRLTAYALLICSISAPAFAGDLLNLPLKTFDAARQNARRATVLEVPNTTVVAPSAPVGTTRQEIQLERPDVQEAKIVQIVPKDLHGDTLMVDLEVVPGRTLTAAELKSNLVLLLDGHALESLPSPGEDAATSKAGGNGVSSGQPNVPEASASAAHVANSPGPTSLGVSLFARLPNSSLVASRAYTLSVYSRRDRRSVALADVTVGTESSAIGWMLPIASGVALLIVVAAAMWGWLRARRRTESQIRGLEDRLATERTRLGGLVGTVGNQVGRAPADTELPTWEIPEALVSALASGEVTPVLGTGAAAEAGLPNFTALCFNILDRLARTGDESRVKELRQALVEQGPDGIIEPLLHRFERARVLKSVCAELATNNARPREFHRYLAALPFSSIVDMGWDRVLEDRALVLVPTPQVFTGARHRGVVEALRTQRFTLIKPRGDIGNPDEIALTHQEFRRIVAQSPELERSLTSLYSTRTLLFLGMSLSGIEQFLASLPPQLGPGGRGHFALVPWGRNVELRSQDFASRLGITLLPFDGSKNFSAVPRFLGELIERVRATEKVPSPAAIGAWQLRRLTLQNIGNFPTLEVDLNPKWTLLLGDNGGGKSTILRAITLALAGSDERGQAMAARLLRTDTDKASITLTMGSPTATHLQTELARDGLKVKASVPLDTPLQAGQALILGFPALRGVSTTQPSGPIRMDEPDPSVDDISPLLLDKVDTRLNQLKQWVINTALQARDAPNSRAARMFATFQDVLRDTVPGRHVEFADIDRDSWTVWLKTDDGKMSFDALSQGTSSILAWVGVLLQRLYGVYPNEVKPEECAAIVLIDEIDAHLHPRWQRRLVSLTRAKFPNVQVIATSHSPLLAGAMHRTELRLVERDQESGEMRAAAPREDIRGQKVDDILTSSLFALPTTRNPEAEDRIRSYIALFENYDRTPEQDAELIKLEGELDQLHYGPTAKKRERLAAVRTQMEEQIDAIPVSAAPTLSALLTGAKDVRPMDEPGVADQEAK